MSVSCMRRGLLLAPLLITSGLVCGAASAVPLTFEYTGVCVYNCEDEGLEVGAPAYMKVVMDDAGYTPEGFFGIEALIDFSFDLGGIELDSATARNVFFGGSWEVIPGGPLVWGLNATTSDGRGDYGPTAIVGGDPVSAGGAASFLGFCDIDPDEGCVASFHTAAQFELKSVMAPVPLPGAGLLLTGAIGILSLSRRRSARSVQ